MNKIFTLIFAILALTAVSQPNYECRSIISENVYVASTAATYNPLASNKHDRVLRDAQLPTGTVAYIFRVTVTEKTTPPTSSLFSEAAKIVGSNLSGAGILQQLVTASDGNSADVYIFDKEEDANKFYNKESGWWACKAYKQTTSTCRLDKDCLNMISFGFRNDNNITGLNIYFELIAIVDLSKQYYSQEVRDKVYESCLTNDKVSSSTHGKTEAFCSCFADKVANDETFNTSQDAATRENRAKEIGASCLQELHLASKSEISSASFYAEAKQIEASTGKSGVISFCEDKLAAGANEDFVYNCLGWNCLLTKQLTKAAYYLKMASEKYPLNLYIQGNYAHALLLTGKYNEAIEIYKAHLNENINEQTSWKASVIGDIEQFKSLGITNEHFDELSSLMK